MSINFGGYNPHMALGPMGARGARPPLTNTLEDLVTWCTKKSAKLIENCCEHPRCWFQHVYKPKLVRNEGRFLDDLETSRWIAGGFPALLTWSAMKNTPNYIVPTPTNRSDAANPLFFWWVKFRSSWREKRSGFDAFFEKKKDLCFFSMSNLCLFVMERVVEKFAAGWADLSAKSRVEASSSLYEARFDHQRVFHENHKCLAQLQLEFRSRIVEMDADERDGLPSRLRVLTKQKKIRFFHIFPGIFWEKKHWKNPISTFSKCRDLFSGLSKWRRAKSSDLDGNVGAPTWSVAEVWNGKSTVFFVPHGFSSGFSEDLCPAKPEAIAAASVWIWPGWKTFPSVTR